MTPDKVSVDAIFIKLGWMEISAVGTLGITALLALVAICVVARAVKAFRDR